MSNIENKKVNVFMIIFPLIKDREKYFSAIVLKI